MQAHPTPGGYTQLGQWFGDHHQFNCATEAFRAALRLDPKSGKLHYLIGLSLYTGGHADEAVTDLTEAAKSAPDVLESHLLLAAALYQVHKLPESEAQWEAALKIDPKSALALDGLANCLLDKGENTSVIGLLGSAPPDDKLALDLGIAYGREGMYDDAASTLSTALAKFPGDLKLTDALVTVYVKQLRYVEAANLAEGLLEKHPDDRAARVLYLRVLVADANQDKADPLATKFLAAAPHDFDFLYLRGVLDDRTGDYAAARRHLEEAVALNPKHYNAHFNLGMALEHLQDAKGAKEQFEAALLLGANEPELRFNLATVLRTLGETEAAKQQLLLYQKELKEKKDRTVAAGKSAQAAVEYAGGDPKKAAALYQEALDATPQNALLAYKLAMALDKAGDTKAERAALDRAVKLDPDLALAQNQIGYLASQNGDTATAEEHFRQALRAAPSFTEAWVSLAAVLGMESRFDEAKAAVANALILEPDNAQALQLSKDLATAQAQR